MKLSEQMQKFNRAVESADRLLAFRCDKDSPELLHGELQARGLFGAARLLRVAGMPLGYFRAKKDFPVDKRSAGTVKGKKPVRKQQRKAKK